MPEPPKSIFVLCDGTGNSVYNKAKEGRFTNVSRIGRCIAPYGEGNRRPQMIHYVRGIGTGEDVGSQRLKQASGLGIEDRIKEAYATLCNNYSGEDDHIFLLGFSRGAFLVRCVADLVCRIGILTRRGLAFLHLVYEEWKMRKGTSYPPVSVSPRPEPNPTDPGSFDELLQHPTLIRREVQIKVCVLWDTVAAIGGPSFASVPTPSDVFGFVDSQMPDGVENAFHALALHERRWDFAPLVWRTGTDRPDDMRQCWFMGYHSDIGGHRDPDSLAHLSLAWMMGRLQRFVDFDTENFCYPPPQGSAWKLTTPPDFPLLSRRDSKTIRYKLRWRDWNRKPCRQFWTPSRVQDDVYPGTYFSNESIHWTVRVLGGLGRYPRSKQMESADNGRGQCRHTGTPHARSWSIPLQSNLPYLVCEENISSNQPSLELSLVNVWLGTELDFLCRTAGCGTYIPGTFIPQVLSRIWDQYNE